MNLFSLTSERQQELGDADERQNQRETAQVRKLKEQLKALLAKPLIPQGTFYAPFDFLSTLLLSINFHS